MSKEKDKKNNNETIGVSAEVAIARAFNLNGINNYAKRSNKAIVKLLEPDIRKIFSNEGVPEPKKYTGENGNPVDFKLKGGKTLSVKTNKKNLGNIAPQKIGQPTKKKYFEYFESFEYFVDFIGVDIDKLNDDDKIKLFKKISIEKTDFIMEQYLINLFSCDYLLVFYNIIDKNDKPNEEYKYILLPKPKNFPKFKQDNFEFTRNKDNWKESCTVKYYFSEENRYLSIGSFQVHKNRDCLKFRFNIANLIKLIK